MQTYQLYLESGPMKRKTMVHVPALAGCIARGDTTESALEATPDAIRAYLRFLARHGERVHPDAAFRATVAEHITEGMWLGNGSVFIEPDREPLTTKDGERGMTRLGWLHDDLRGVTGRLTARRLDAEPGKGRTIRHILRHLTGEGGYLRGVAGASRLQRLVDEGVLDPLDALDELLVLEQSRLRAMTPDELSAVQQRGQSPWSARYALRRMLEHAWEHYIEITGRLGVEA